MRPSFKERQISIGGEQSTYNLVIMELTMGAIER